ncbi:3-oxoacyl-[acyl-carrier-protein] reductase [Kineosporia mesophila]|uniref:3-oxoacyl-[acyl-carrier-protein] reductase n=1 Tax=Kineosporia mesophila TaxID=566012 RepID=A0ABP6ZLF2_9ACTN
MIVARSVLVTGGNRGIGLAIARAMAEDGDAVTVTHRSGEPPAGLKGVICEITDAESVKNAVAQVEADQGPIEVLVANAGVTRDTLLMRMSDDDWDSVVDTNLGGTFRCVRAVSKSMIKARRGRIILVGSVVGLMGSPGQVNYAATKSGLVGMARAITREIGGRGITTNVVAPGFIDTDMTASLPEKVRNEYLSRIPAGRFGNVDEIAATVRFLASDSAAYITGAVIPVDGGIGMGH